MTGHVGDGEDRETDTDDLHHEVGDEDFAENKECTGEDAD